MRRGLQGKERRKSMSSKKSRKQSSGNRKLALLGTASGDNFCGKESLLTFQLKSYDGSGAVGMSLEQAMNGSPRSWAQFSDASFSVRESSTLVSTTQQALMDVIPHTVSTNTTATNSSEEEPYSREASKKNWRKKSRFSKGTDTSNDGTVSRLWRKVTKSGLLSKKDETTTQVPVQLRPVFKSTEDQTKNQNNTLSTKQKAMLRAENHHRKARGRLGIDERIDVFEPILNMKLPDAEHIDFRHKTSAVRPEDSTVSSNEYGDKYVTKEMKSSVASCQSISQNTQRSMTNKTNSSPLCIRSEERAMVTRRDESNLGSSPCSVGSEQHPQNFLKSGLFEGENVISRVQQSLSVDVKDQQVVTMSDQDVTTADTRPLPNRDTHSIEVSKLKERKLERNVVISTLSYTSSQHCNTNHRSISLCNDRSSQFVKTDTSPQCTNGKSTAMAQSPRCRNTRSLAESIEPLKNKSLIMRPAAEESDRPSFCWSHPKAEKEELAATTIQKDNATSTRPIDNDRCSRLLQNRQEPQSVDPNNIQSELQIPTSTRVRRGLGIEPCVDVFEASVQPDFSGADDLLPKSERRKLYSSDDNIYQASPYNSGPIVSRRAFEPNSSHDITGKDAQTTNVSQYSNDFDPTFLMSSDTDVLDEILRSESSIDKESIIDQHVESMNHHVETSSNDDKKQVDRLLPMLKLDVLSAQKSNKNAEALKNSDTTIVASRQFYAGIVDSHKIEASPRIRNLELQHKERKPEPPGMAASHLISADGQMFAGTEPSLHGSGQIQKYWKAYSTVRSRGSFDSTSLLDESQKLVYGPMFTNLSDCTSGASSDSRDDILFNPPTQPSPTDSEYFRELLRPHTKPVPNKVTRSNTLENAEAEARIIPLKQKSNDFRQLDEQVKVEPIIDCTSPLRNYTKDFASPNRFLNATTCVTREATEYTVRQKKPGMDPPEVKATPRDDTFRHQQTAKAIADSDQYSEIKSVSSNSSVCAVKWEASSVYSDETESSTKSNQLVSDQSDTYSVRMTGPEASIYTIKELESNSNSNSTDDQEAPPVSHEHYHRRESSLDYMPNALSPPSSIHDSSWKLLHIDRKHNERSSHFIDDLKLSAVSLDQYHENRRESNVDYKPNLQPQLHTDQKYNGRHIDSTNHLEASPVSLDHYPENRRESNVDYKPNALKPLSSIHDSTWSHLHTDRKHNERSSTWRSLFPSQNDAQKFIQSAKSVRTLFPSRTDDQNLDRWQPTPKDCDSVNTCHDWDDYLSKKNGIGKGSLSDPIETDTLSSSIPCPGDNYIDSAPRLDRYENSTSFSNENNATFSEKISNKTVNCSKLPILPARSFEHLIDKFPAAMVKRGSFDSVNYSIYEESVVSDSAASTRVFEGTVFSFEHKERTRSPLVYRKNLPSPLKKSLIQAMSPMMDTFDEESTTQTDDVSSFDDTTLTGARIGCDAGCDSFWTPVYDFCVGIPERFNNCKN